MTDNRVMERGRLATEYGHWGMPRAQMRFAAHAKAFSNILVLLKKSKALDSSGYTQLLRNGVKLSPTARAFSVGAQVNNQVQQARQALTSGLVVHAVEDEADLAEIEYWRQGDASMATAEKIAQRQALRYDRHVLEALQALWEAAQRSLQSGGDVYADALHAEGHALMLRRVYRVMLKDFDAADCERCIADDWERDAKGKSTLTRKHFGDAFFELADTWVCENAVV